MVEVGAHYRRVDGGGTAVFRVVGVPDDVTLLRVTDGDGRRVYTGEISHVPPETLATAFESTADPDAGFSPRRSVRNALQGMYWELRMLLTFVGGRRHR